MNAKSPMPNAMTLSLSRIVLAFLLLCAASSLSSCRDPALVESAKKDALKFSNTMTWRPDYLSWAQKAEALPGVGIPSPPKNSSAETQEDLRVMHGYQAARTAAQIEEIKSEIDILQARFGDQTLAQHVDQKRRPNSFDLMAFVTEIEGPQVMRQKQLFDRVRPSFLDPTIKPAIPVPPHPAYPSGHATQAFLRAFVLGSLDPKNASVYLKSAERIARNREIAGLHYPSDSAAGRALAQQLFAVLSRDPNFVQQFWLAKKEW